MILDGKGDQGDCLSLIKGPQDPQEKGDIDFLQLDHVTGKAVRLFPDYLDPHFTHLLEVISNGVGCRFGHSNPIARFAMPSQNRADLAAADSVTMDKEITVESFKP
jgi:hypothetical protein